jgi:hypothetical protein
VNKLFESIISTPGQDASPLELEKTMLVHKLLVDLLTVQRPVEDAMGGPFDYSLMLAMSNGEDGFKRPSQVQAYCCMLEYCLRVIVIHCARLGELDANYVSLQAQNNSLKTKVGTGVATIKLDGVSIPLDEFLVLGSQAQDQDFAQTSSDSLLDLDGADADEYDDCNRDLWKTFALDSSDVPFTNPMAAICVENSELELQNTLQRDDSLVCVYIHCRLKSTNIQF